MADNRGWAICGVHGFLKRQLVAGGPAVCVPCKQEEAERIRRAVSGMAATPIEQLTCVEVPVVEGEGG